MERLNEIYPKCRLLLGETHWNTVKKAARAVAPPEFPEWLASYRPDSMIPCLIELARVEWIVHGLSQAPEPIPERGEGFLLNPNLSLLSQAYTLSSVFDHPAKLPLEKENYLMIRRHPVTGRVLLDEATQKDLLAIKITSEDLDLQSIARMQQGSVYQVMALLYRAADRGLLLAPAPKIRRTEGAFPLDDVDSGFIRATHFTIQWHITHACDLHCKHCYDRSKRSPLTRDQGRSLLDQLIRFCEERRVRGHVCFTGGNPFLSPHFEALYQYAADLGLGTSILANPVPHEKVRRIVDIQMPAYFQVSLEGFSEHNDCIRGSGNFHNVIEFLGVLRDLNVHSAVMLTLTRSNTDQVIPLGERLRGHADRFTFNRLSPVGEGTQLETVSPAEYEVFLREYVAASKTNPILSFKDNLINILRHEQGKPIYGGCTGYGCGAAFSFMAVLPDGEVHACRKFPSFLGNANRQSLAEIYDTALAERYRRGAFACHDCELRPGCGGCMAMVYGNGGDVFSEKDPYCFKRA